MRHLSVFRVAMFATICASMGLTEVETAMSDTEKAGAPSEYHVYVGTYTGGKSTSKGIYAYRWIPGEHKFTSLGLSAETVSPLAPGC